jgi:deoxyribose-phosphate aldolase
MIIEISFHDLETKEIDLKTNIIKAIKYQPDYISVFSQYAKFAKKITSNNIPITVPIDYPLGISDLKTRQTEIVAAAKNGASKVDIVIPILSLINRKYDKFREDIQNNLGLCERLNINIAYMLEYRIFNHVALTKICNILKEFKLSTAYVSTGYMLDDISDNLIASMYLAQKSEMKTIINGNVWNKNHINNIVKYKPYGLRLKNIYSLELWYDNQKNQIK